MENPWFGPGLQICIMTITTRLQVSTIFFSVIENYKLHKTLIAIYKKNALYILIFSIFIYVI